MNSVQLENIILYHSIRFCVCGPWLHLFIHFPCSKWNYDDDDLISLAIFSYIKIEKIIIQILQTNKQLENSEKQFWILIRIQQHQIQRNVMCFVCFKALLAVKTDSFFLFLCKNYGCCLFVFASGVSVWILINWIKIIIIIIIVIQRKQCLKINSSFVKKNFEI